MSAEDKKKQIDCFGNCPIDICNWYYGFRYNIMEVPGISRDGIVLVKTCEKQAKFSKTRELFAAVKAGNKASGAIMGRVTEQGE